MKTKGSGRINTYQICLVAMAVVINIVGGQIALMLRLPVYLDSIGTILTGAVLGPWFGMLPNLLSGIFMGMTVDAPVGMITGIMSGILLHGETAGKSVKGRWIFLKGLGVSVPGTIMSAVINAALFGGVTSSGSTVIVQLLAREHFRRAVPDGLYRPLCFNFRGERDPSAGIRRTAPQNIRRQVDRWNATV